MDNLQKFLITLSAKIREKILPHLGSLFSRRIEGIAKSGDTTFSLDTLAEKTLENFIKEANLRCAYYSEDKGLVNFHHHPEYLLIVDPIDGTRPAACELDLATICISILKFKSDPTQKDVLAGLVRELYSGRVFYALKNKGAMMIEGRKKSCLHPSANKDHKKMFWAFELAGRPIEPIARIVSPLIEASSIQAGIFIFNSSAFAITRVARGNLDAFIDIAGRVLTDFPHTEQLFLKAGLGKIVGLFPYDVSAAILIAQEAGCCISDAYGRSLDDKPLMASSSKGILSCIVSGNKTLHRKILSILERSFSTYSA